MDHALLGALVILLAIRILQAWRQDRIMRDTASALCTMLAEWYEDAREGRA